MKIFGQPDSYSEILQRVFCFSLGVGICYTVFLSRVSPDVKTFIESFNMEADIGPIKGLKALCFVIPLLLAIFSRMILLHDKISDILRIRYSFDMRHILFPLAQAVGIVLTKAQKRHIGTVRDTAMYPVFYEFAGFNNPKIDKQLVRSALDRWGWFWVVVESSVLTLVTGSILAALRQWHHVIIFGIVLGLLLLFLVYQWFVCCRSAKAEIDAILVDEDRRRIIRDYFEKLLDSI